MAKNASVEINLSSTVSKHLLLGLPLKICRTIPRGLVVQAMDFGASTSGFEARLCHLIFYLFGIEYCYSTKILASATHPTLLWAPIFHQREDEDNGFTFFNAGSSPSLRFVNRNEGTLRRAGWVAFTKTYSRGKWLISHLPPTFVIIIHIPCPLSPCIWRPRVPVPHVPTSQTWCAQVPRLASPSPTASFQALSVNAFRWRIPDERSGDAWTISECACVSMFTRSTEIIYK